MLRSAPPATPTFRLYLFGTFRLEVRDGSAVHAVHLPRRKVESLLAYLALHPASGGHSREKLALLLWGDQPDAQARSSLRTSLAVLRKTLGADAFVAAHDRVQLNPALPLWIDVVEFQREHILDLYCGDLLSDSYDEWVLVWRDQLRAHYIDLLEHVTQDQRARSEYEQAIASARKILAIDPAHEVAHQHIMVCELARGNRAGAVAQYALCERALRAELAVEPSAETQALYQWLQQTPAPLTSIAARLTNLPLPFTSFIGRKAELMHIKHMLTHTRLLTLVGAGGSGKTRLAIQASLELLNAFHDGIWWVELAPLASPELVAQAVLKTLGLSEEAQLNPPEMLRQFLRDKNLLLILDNCEHVVGACAALAEIILQSCPAITVLATSREALAITGETVWQVPTLPVPEALPTREQLLLNYESIRLFVERAQAVNSRFALTPDNATAVIQICGRLDGIPLAIELAAAQVAMLSVSDIAARLDDRFDLLTRGAGTALPRQQTLRALIDWSYALLTAEERVLFRRLAVFAAQFSLEAAEAICADAQLPRARLLPGLAQLTAKSLLLTHHQTTARFYLLETIRQYAYEKLVEAGEADGVRQCHWDWYSHAAAQAAGQVRGADQLVWLDRLEADHADVRTALTWAQARSTAQAFQDMVANLGQFWSLRGYWYEGRDWLQAALHRGGPLSSRAQVLFELAELTNHLDSPAASQPWFEEALTVYRALNDRRGIALTLTHLIKTDLDLAHAQVLFDECLPLAQSLGDVWLMALAYLSIGLCAMRFDQPIRGAAYLEQALVYARRAGDRWIISATLNNLGEWARGCGDYDRAAAFYAEGQALQRTLGDKHGLAISLHNLAHVALHQAAWAQCHAWFRESWQHFQDLNQWQGLLECAAGLGCLAAVRQHFERAARLLGWAEAALITGGQQLDPIDRVDVEAALALTRSRLSPAVFEAAWSAGQALTLAQVTELVLVD